MDNYVVEFMNRGTKHSGTELLFVDESLIGVAEAMASEFTPGKGYVILTDNNLGEIKTELSPIYSYEELLKISRSVASPLLGAG